MNNLVKMPMSDANSGMHHLRYKACLSLNQFRAALVRWGENGKTCSDNSHLDLFCFQISSPFHAHLFTFWLLSMCTKEKWKKIILWLFQCISALLENKFAAQIKNYPIIHKYSILQMVKLQGLKEFIYSSRNP